MNNVQTLVADGEELPVEPASFDAVVRRLGLMFFPSEQRLGIFTTDDGWVGPNELLLTAAQRSD